MGKIIQFPSRKTIQNKDIVENLHIEIENCEALLKEALEHLEYLNEEIVMLTEEHTQLLNDLIKKPRSWAETGFLVVMDGPFLIAVTEQN